MENWKAYEGATLTLIAPCPSMKISKICYNGCILNASM